MRKHIISLTFVLIFLLVGCGNSETETSRNIGSDKRVTDAIEIVAEHWNNEYEKSEIEDKYLEIINTRIIEIKDNINSEKIYGKDELFKGIDYIVEFELLSNYFDSAPYYFNAWKDNFVVVYEDGNAKVSDNLFNIYRAAAYSADFTPIIDSIEDFHGEYDQTLELK